MPIDISMTAKLSKDQIAEIITEYLEREGYKVEGEINFLIKGQTVGHGMDEHYENVFSGISVKVKK